MSIPAIKDILLEERPREKLRSRGASSLSDAELVAAILGSGGRHYGVHRLAEQVLEAVDRNRTVTLDTLLEIPGIGAAKAGLLIAALEFARRRIRPAGIRINSPEDVLPLVRHLSDRKQEHLICISLNGANEVITSRIVTVGLANCTQIHPREVFADPIVDRACGIILAHNHPSGSLTPSTQDNKVTASISEAAKLLGIELLDHVIFSHTGYFSFREAGSL